MADKMVVEDKKEPASSSLVPPVTVEKKNKKQAPPLLAVQLVSLWALLTVTIFLGSLAFAATMVHYHIDTPSWFAAGAELTDAAAAELCAIILVAPWCMCIAAAAATAVLALLLPDRRCSRSCWVLACVTLAVTATIHLMLARVFILVFTIDLGNIFWWILVTVEMFFVAAGDIHCFQALLGRGAYANVPAAA